MYDVKEVLAGNVFTSEPNSQSIHIRAATIANNAIRLEGWRDKGVANTAYKSNLLDAIEHMREGLNAMEKWAKLEKPE